MVVRLDTRDNSNDKDNDSEIVLVLKMAYKMWGAGVEVDRCHSPALFHLHGSTWTVVQNFSSPI